MNSTAIIAWYFWRGREHVAITWHVRLEAAWHWAAYLQDSWERFPAPGMRCLTVIELP